MKTPEHFAVIPESSVSTSSSDASKALANQIRRCGHEVGISLSPALLFLYLHLHQNESECAASDAYEVTVLRVILLFSMLYLNVWS